MTTDVCPYAFGFIPQELDCQMRRELDSRRGVSWWRRLWRSFIGYYNCPCEGLLPCGRFSVLRGEYGRWSS